MKRSTLTEGIMCCCKFTDDDSWYRVRVESFVGDKKVFICCVCVCVCVTVGSTKMSFQNSQCDFQNSS